MKVIYVRSEMEFMSKNVFAALFTFVFDVPSERWTEARRLPEKVTLINKKLQKIIVDSIKHESLIDFNNCDVIQKKKLEQKNTWNIFNESFWLLSVKGIDLVYQLRQQHKTLIGLKTQL